MSLRTVSVQHIPLVICEWKDFIVCSSDKDTIDFFITIWISDQRTLILTVSFLPLVP